MLFSIYTLGCKVNQYESEAMSEKLLEYGYKAADKGEQADVYIINSCTVTAVSDNKALKLLRRLRRSYPAAIIVLTGCMPQAFPNMKESFSQADIILGNKCRADLIPAIESFIINKKQIVNIKEYDKETEFESLSVRNFSGHTRAFVKIEDGCNRFCSYCIIPYARGRVRSKKPEELKNELIELANAGYKEVVLVGINLSAYGSEFSMCLADAVEIACNTKGIDRVRLGSLEPERMDTAIIKRLSVQKKLCPQFHLSLQSGCDETLKRMNRHYTAAEYLEIVENLRKSFANASITTDVMVGFAGETDEEFQKSLDFVKMIGFEKVHVFPYSRRAGTKADTFDNQVDESVKEKRSKIMIEAAAARRKEFLHSQVGTACEVLVERFHNKSYYEGYTKNYTPVHIYTSQKLEQGIYNILLTEAFDDYCRGELT